MLGNSDRSLRCRHAMADYPTHLAASCSMPVFGHEEATPHGEQTRRVLAVGSALDVQRVTEAYLNDESSARTCDLLKGKDDGHWELCWLKLSKRRSFTLVVRSVRFKEVASPTSLCSSDPWRKSRHRGVGPRDRTFDNHIRALELFMNACRQVSAMSVSSRSSDPLL
jgi:hypothetical protein